MVIASERKVSRCFSSSTIFVRQFLQATIKHQGFNVTCFLVFDVRYFLTI